MTVVKINTGAKQAPSRSHERRTNLRLRLTQAYRMRRADVWEVWLKNCKVCPYRHLHQDIDRRNTSKAVLLNVINSLQIIMFHRSYAFLLSRFFSRDAKQGQGKRASVKVRLDFSA
jgi:hypothetical protein